MRNLAGAAFATIQDYPSIAAGSCAFLVAFALVAGNAMLSQPGGHPDPLWATRDRVTTQSVAKRQAQIPVRKVSVETITPETVGPAVIPVPLKRPPLASDPVVHDQPAHDQVGDHGDLVRQTQEALARLGLYDGKVDGVYGPVTREAILDFQRANGLKSDGEVNLAVLDEARALIGRPKVASSTEIADAGVIEQRMGTANAPRSAQSEVTAEPAVATSSLRAVPAVESPEDIAKAARIARIQIGLLNFGESGIAVDGVLGPHTVDAIRTFQERYGMPVTGEPEEAVIRKMEQIGALHNS
ncbi:MAG: peptidoglycan-binding protein [Salaquimonas sp.]|nr:peptidoglycan-binding protein [Salaquimonas sp.]